MGRIDSSEPGRLLGGYRNGQNEGQWWLRSDGRGAAGVKSLDSGNISEEVLLGLADRLEVQSK